MNQIVVKHMESDGNAINLDLGGVPTLAIVMNTAAATTESAIIVWLKDLNNEINITAQGEFTYVTSNTIVSYDASAIDSGTTDDDDDPVRLAGFQGITIPAGFSDDSDEIIVIAIFADIDADEGDINA